MKRIGPTFSQDLGAAGLFGIPVAWSDEGEFFGLENLSPEQRAALDQVIAAHDPDATVAPPRRYSKAAFFTAMTDAEYATYEQVEARQSKRERAIFINATEIAEGHELFAKFERLVLQTYGEARGHELLLKARV